jgi:hypothetical protein
MSCNENHYGKIPDLFRNVQLKLFELKGSETEKMLKLLKHVYTQSKHIVLNKTCVRGEKNIFLSTALGFFYTFQNTPFFEELNDEISTVREIVESNTSLMNDNFIFAKLCLMEKNYKKSLFHIKKYQHEITSKVGNYAETIMMRCYTIKVQCYIGLKNKKMAKKALKFFLSKFKAEKRLQLVEDVSFKEPKTKLAEKYLFLAL